MFDKKGKPILLSKTQSNIVKTLINEAQGDNIPVSVETLIKKCWNNKKENTSIFTVRNMIKQIRNKTFYELIKSHSRKGYSIDYPLNIN